jgi:predicted RNase H-like HicB family nuclease
MPQTRTYSLMVERDPEGKGYLAHFPALPGCQTWGSTYEHAVQMAEEALVGFLEAAAKAGKKLPVEKHHAPGVALGLVVYLPVNV